MGCKRKMIMRIVLLILLFVFCVMIYIVSQNKKVDYSNSIISTLNEQGKTTVQNVFPFEFERAYVFNDCYISGEGFAKRYNLDISITQVECGVSENVQRIVFVDKFGAFVYEFKCDSSEIIVLEKGIVIYPETVIERNSSVGKEPLEIRFNSVERYDT